MRVSPDSSSIAKDPAPHAPDTEAPSAPPDPNVCESSSEHVGKPSKDLSEPSVDAQHARQDDAFDAARDSAIPVVGIPSVYRGETAEKCVDSERGREDPATDAPRVTEPSPSWVARTRAALYAPVKSFKTVRQRVLPPCRYAPS